MYQLLEIKNPIILWNRHIFCYCVFATMQLNCGHLPKKDVEQDINLFLLYHFVTLPESMPEMLVK